MENVANIMILVNENHNNTAEANTNNDRTRKSPLIGPEYPNAKTNAEVFSNNNTNYNHDANSCINKFLSNHNNYNDNNNNRSEEADDNHSATEIAYKQRIQREELIAKEEFISDTDALEETLKHRTNSTILNNSSVFNDEGPNAKAPNGTYEDNDSNAAYSLGVNGISADSRTNNNNNNNNNNANHNRYNNNNANNMNYGNNDRSNERQHQNRQKTPKSTLLQTMKNHHTNNSNNSNNNGVDCNNNMNNNNNNNNDDNSINIINNNNNIDKNNDNSGPTRPVLLERCAGCKLPIRDKFLLKAEDKFWHEDCLKCSCCDCRLGEVGSTFFLKANLFLCKRDYLRLFGNTGYCTACERVIPAFEMVMKAKANVYHLECFACQECSHRFCVGDKFYLWQNRILCERDYKDILTTFQLYQQQQQIHLQQTQRLPNNSLPPCHQSLDEVNNSNGGILLPPNNPGNCIMSTTSPTTPLFPNQYPLHSSAGINKPYIEDFADGSINLPTTNSASSASISMGFHNTAKNGSRKKHLSDPQLTNGHSLLTVEDTFYGNNSNGPYYQDEPGCFIGKNRSCCINENFSSAVGIEEFNDQYYKSVDSKTLKPAHLGNGPEYSCYEPFPQMAPADGAGVNCIPPSQSGQSITPLSLTDVSKPTTGHHNVLDTGDTNVTMNGGSHKRLKRSASHSVGSTSPPLPPSKSSPKHLSAVNIASIKSSYSEPGGSIETNLSTTLKTDQPNFLPQHLRQQLPSSLTTQCNFNNTFGSPNSVNGSYYQYPSNSNNNNNPIQLFDSHFDDGGGKFNGTPAAKKPRSYRHHPKAAVFGKHTLAKSSNFHQESPLICSNSMDHNGFDIYPNRNLTIRDPYLTVSCSPNGIINGQSHQNHAHSIQNNNNNVNSYMGLENASSV